jgi:dihydroorotate dehydrogenase electron transfer subunit
MCLERSDHTGLTRAVVASHAEAAENLWRLVLFTSNWTGSRPDPGQFLMLRTSEGNDPLLARPFGIAGFECDGSEASLEILYRVVGRGTKAMTQWTAGQETRFLGPLGRGFDLPPEGSRSLLIAGGIGLPPLLSLAREMAIRGRPGELTLLYGDITGDRMLDPVEGAFPDVQVLICTEDGSLGTKGLVTDVLREIGGGEGYHLFSCGPNAMMKAVRDMAGGRCLSDQYSLEARMACGFGVCAGCAVLVPDKGTKSYVRVCREGPVFDGKNLIEESFGEI